MKKLPELCITVAVVCIVLGIISRLIFTPIIVPARAYIGFAGVLLLLSIALMLKEKVGVK